LGCPAGLTTSVRQRQFVPLCQPLARKTPSADRKLRLTGDFRETREKAMKVYWNDGARGPDAKNWQDASLNEARIVCWTCTQDEGNFDEVIPDYVDDRSDLRIIPVDLPQSAQKSSYIRRVTTGEILGLIERAFNVAANLEMYVSKRGSGVRVLGLRVQFAGSRLIQSLLRNRHWGDTNSSQNVVPQERRCRAKFMLGRSHDYVLHRLEVQRRP
jgi:hypothetical protein